MRISIEPIANVDEFSFSEWLDEDDSSRRFVSRSVPSYAGTRKLFHQICNMAVRDDFFAWAQRTDEGTIMAYAELKRSEKVKETELELIYVVSELWRGKGIATSLVRDIVNRGAKEAQKKIVAYVSPSNIASRKVLSRNQFVEMPSRFNGVRYERGIYA